MRILELKQRTPEWLEFRKTHVTATDIATLMTGSPSEQYNLLLTKKGLKTTHLTPAMLRGTEMEEVAVAWKLGRRKSITSPCIMHDDNEIIMASLDVLIKKDKYILEVKCPVDPQETVESYPRYRKAYWQIQTALFVTGYESAELLIYHPLRSVSLIIERNEYHISRLVNKAAEFHSLMQKEIPQDVIESLEVMEIKNQDLWDRGRQGKEMALKGKEIMDQVRQECIELAEDLGTHKLKCFGLSLNRSMDMPAVDYKQAAIQSQIDLSAFETIRKGSWRLNVSV